MSAERVKLTKAQEDLLAVASGSLAGLRKGDFLGPYWRVIDRLEVLGLLRKRVLANGSKFEITEAGRAALGDRS